MKFSEVEKIIREKYPPDSMVVRLFDDTEKDDNPYETQQGRFDTGVKVRIHEVNEEINEKGGCYEHPD